MSNGNPPPATTIAPRRPTPPWKKALFATVAGVGLLAVAELLLALLGVSTLLQREDPFRGFSGLVTVFERDGDHYRTRRATLKTTFNDQSFLVDKPANGLRIFSLGGSSSFGFPWGADVAFTAVLGELLAASHPDRQVEAINASGVSYAMHRLNIVADELRRYQPDVFIIYSGHNEFIEPAFFEALKRRAAVRTQVEYVLAQSRIYAALRQLLDRSEPAPTPPVGDFDLQVRRDVTRVFSPEEKAEIVAEYRWRLERLVRLAKEAGIQVLVSTVPCNLSDWQPGASDGLRNLDEADQQAFAAALGSGTRRLAAGEWDAATAELERAIRLAPDHAEAQYQFGKALQALGRWDDARAAYIRACDADASPIRRISGINDAIRQISREQGALLVDSDRIFEQESEHGLVGLNLIEDYVHPTHKGHQLIAWHMWDSIERAGWLGASGAADRALFDRVVAARDQPTVRNATWFYNQGVVLANQGHTAEAIQAFREALAVSPDYVGAMANLGKLLWESGQAGEAVEVLSRARDLEPGRGEIHTNLGNALRAVGRADEAVAAHQQALRVNPDYAEAHFNLANVLQSQGRLDEALAHYQEALRIKPDAADTANNLAHTLLRLGRVAEAVPHFESVVRLKPDLASARNYLAMSLLRLGRAPEAVAQWGKAFELTPNDVQVGSNLAWLLATHPDPAVRDGARAVTIAKRLWEAPGKRDPRTLGILAAAYAESGNYPQAVQSIEQAMELSPAGWREGLERQLQLYRAGQPFRDQRAAGR